MKKQMSKEYEVKKIKLLKKVKTISVQVYKTN